MPVVPGVDHAKLGSTGPAGLTRWLRLALVLTWSCSPRGLGGMVPSLRNHRRLRFARFLVRTEANPGRLEGLDGLYDGFLEFLVLELLVSLFARRSFATFGGGMGVGGAKSSISSVFHPVFSAARALARSDMSLRSRWRRSGR